MTEKLCDIGLIGLGVMGRNFALNMADKGFRVSVYNRTEEKTRSFIEKEKGNRPIEAYYNLREFTQSLKRPRVALIFVTAGDPVGKVIDELTDHLDSGDLIVDCGNSHFEDTNRRDKFLAQKGFLFLGMGVSGGESGARHGPSLMPGGSEKAYKMVNTILEPSAAQINGEPCVAYLGSGSAGHYVKMVHNGIEYGIMQLIAESCDLLMRGLGYDAGSLSPVFEEWNRGKLNSYLIEITSRVLERKDDRTGDPIVDIIVDRARQKGTGKWSSCDAMDLQAPVPSIDIAVAMRNMSDLKEEREIAGTILSGSSKVFKGDPKTVVGQVREALFASMIITYAQGFAQLNKASVKYEYGLNPETVARIWRGGCIIRAQLLEDIRKVFQGNPDMKNLLLSPALGREVNEREKDLREAVRTGVDLGIPVPGFMSALAYYDSYRSSRLPANIIMAQRDYFGSHRYERIDAEGTFHTDWES